MTRQTYRASLGQAAQALRVETGYKSVAALVRTGRISESTARRVEGSKEPEKDLQWATIEEYATVLGVTPGELFARADQVHARVNPGWGVHMPTFQELASEASAVVESLATRLMSPDLEVIKEAVLSDADAALAARVTPDGKPSRGQQQRRAQDDTGEQPDEPGPELGA